jgi:hypothetical protein
MGEISNAQWNMKQRFISAQEVLRSIFTHPTIWADYGTKKEITALIGKHQAEIASIVEINIINRRIQSCGK